MQIPRQVFARSLAALLLGVATALAATGSDIPPHGKAVALFNGRDLGNFETFLRDQGLNHDPDHVFRVEKHVIHVSGKEFGYIITRKEFANYYLRAEFKWGEGTYAPRQGRLATAEFSTTYKDHRKFGRPRSSFRFWKAGPEISG